MRSAAFLGRARHRWGKCGNNPDARGFTRPRAGPASGLRYRQPTSASVDQNESPGLAHASVSQRSNILPVLPESTSALWDAGWCRKPRAGRSGASRDAFHGKGYRGHESDCRVLAGGGGRRCFSPGTRPRAAAAAAAARGSNLHGFRGITGVSRLGRCCSAAHPRGLPPPKSVPRGAAQDVFQTGNSWCQR